jgi:protein FAM32A
MAPTFIGGKLRLKGEGTTKKTLPKKAAKFDTSNAIQKTNTSTAAAAAAAAGSSSKMESSSTKEIIEDDGLTVAERKSLKIKLEREKAELEKLAHKSHRERVEEFNEKLSSLTELNDIPRVSAAGNG